MATRLGWLCASLCVIGATMILSALAPGSAAAQLDPETRRELDGVLADYEILRAELAADRGGRVAAVARRLGERAARARTSAPPALGSLLSSVAAAAGRLAQAPAADLAALRRGFGALSRPLIQLLRSQPELARGQHFFECPMAEGYGGWFQTAERLENPYMGSRMLRCGRPMRP